MNFFSFLKTSNCCCQETYIQKEKNLERKAEKSIQLKNLKGEKGNQEGPGSLNDVCVIRKVSLDQEPKPESSKVLEENHKIEIISGSFDKPEGKDSIAQDSILLDGDDHELQVSLAFSPASLNLHDEQEKKCLLNKAASIKVVDHPIHKSKFISHCDLGKMDEKEIPSSSKDLNPSLNQPKNPNGIGSSDLERLCQTPKLKGAQIIHKKSLTIHCNRKFLVINGIERVESQRSSRSVKVNKNN